MTKQKDLQLPLETSGNALAETEGVSAVPPSDSKAAEVSIAPTAVRDTSVTPAAQERAQVSTKGERQELFIPVSGFVWLYPEEIRVLDHPAVQRLGLIYQLGQTYLVYRGATHKRLEHAIGTVHVVQRMIDAIQNTSQKSLKKHRSCGAPLQRAEERFVRLGALLHDIGHVTAGHTVEDELGLIGKHDGDDRLDLLLEDNEGRWLDLSDRKLGDLINQEYETYLPESLRKEGITSAEIVRLLIRKPPKDQDRFGRQENILTQSNDIRLQICRDLIGNTICADLLDYLIRDWYHIGKTKPLDDRIFQYMEIRPFPRPGIIDEYPPHYADQFVISIGARPNFRTDAISSILELLEWRYQLAESVLFHRTKLAATAMLDRALYELLYDGGNTVETTFLQLSDEQMLAECLKIAKEIGDKGKVAAKLLASLQRRQLFAGLCTFSHYDLLADVKDEIQEIYTLKQDHETDLAPKNRNTVLRILEEDFKLPEGSLAMYCPPGDMKGKIAEVKIAVGNKVERFCDYEKKYENQLSAGHLEAQLSRFSRLWRVHFFIDRQVKEGLSGQLLEILKEAIAKIALGHYRDAKEDTNLIVQRFACLLANTPESPWYGFKVRDVQELAAYRKESVSYGLYPSGALSIRSYLHGKEIKN
jgi:HD superfamily phosphohydrolase